MTYNSILYLLSEDIHSCTLNVCVLIFLHGEVDVIKSFVILSSVKGLNGSNDGATEGATATA